MWIRSSNGIKKISTKKSRNNKDSSNTKIYSLSYNSNLDGDESTRQDFAVYEAFLDECFRMDNVCNIAITGDYGVGKSSVIRTYDEVRHCCSKDHKATFFDWAFNHRKEFLYVSLANFRNWDSGQKLDTNIIRVQSDPNSQNNQESRDNQESQNNQESRNNQKSKSRSESKIRQDCQNCLKSWDNLDSQNRLEKELLCQVLLACDGARLMDETGEPVPARKGFRYKLLLWMAAVVIVCIFMIVFFAQLASGIKFMAANYPRSHILQYLVNHGGVLHSLLYWVLGIGIVVLVMILLRWIGANFHPVQVQVETAMIKASAKMGPTPQEGYLNRHKWLMIHSLEKVAKRIDYTVVFEDMDRLDMKYERELYAQLREINQLLNARVRHKGFHHHFRFLYVSKDLVVGKYNEDVKFFDYTLPIVPSLSEQTVCERLVNDYLPQVGIRMDEYAEDESLRPENYFEDAGVYLADYRTLYAVLNEFRVLKAVNTQRGTLGQGNELYLMALVIYKKLCPDDFYRIREGGSALFGAEAHAERLGNPFVEHLYELGFLKPFVLKYLGYSRGQMARVYRNILLHGDTVQRRNLFHAEGEETEEGLNFVTEQDETIMEILRDFDKGQMQQCARSLEFAFAHFLLKQVEADPNNRDTQGEVISVLRDVKRTGKHDNPYPAGEGRDMDGVNIARDTSGEETLGCYLTDCQNHALKFTVVDGSRPKDIDFLMALLSYLGSWNYRDRSQYEWLLKTKEGNAAYLWDVFMNMDEADVAGLFENGWQGLYGWLLSGNVMQEAIQTAQKTLAYDNEQAKRYLEIIRKIAGDNDLPPRFAEMTLIWNGKKMTVPEWISDAG